MLKKLKKLFIEMLNNKIYTIHDADRWYEEDGK